MKLESKSKTVIINQLKWKKLHDREDSKEMMFTEVDNIKEIE